MREHVKHMTASISSADSAHFESQYILYKD
uniref:Uncharacterized protein n=1 Tax=Rhizophora mucronata TaxID=61149 RepID=A0A2P2PVK5_RHIMU